MTGWLLVLLLWLSIAGLVGCLVGWVINDCGSTPMPSREESRHLRLIDRPAPFDFEQEMGA